MRESTYEPIDARARVQFTHARAHAQTHTHTHTHTHTQDVALLAQACVWALLDGLADLVSSAAAATPAGAHSASAAMASSSASGGGQRKRWFNVVAVRDGTVPTAWRPDVPLAAADLPAVQARMRARTCAEDTHFIILAVAVRWIFDVRLRAVLERPSSYF